MIGPSGGLIREARDQEIILSPSSMRELAAELTGIVADEFARSREGEVEDQEPLPELELPEDTLGVVQATASYLDRYAGTTLTFVPVEPWGGFGHPWRHDPWRTRGL
jgi:hypothetical protein